MEMGWRWPPTESGWWGMRMFGRFEVASVNGSLPKLRSRQSYGLLSYLALHLGREFSRYELEETFWPDSDGDRQAQNLRKCISDLRHTLEEESDRGRILVTRREHTAISSERILTDVEAFRSLLHKAETCPHSERRQALNDAFHLYAGPLLPTITQSWAVPVRLNLEEQYARAVGSLIDLLIQDREAGVATQAGRKAVIAAPLREDIHIALIRAYGAAGQAAEGMRQYEELERLLDEHWGESPSDKAQEALECLPSGGKRPVDRSRAVVSHEGADQIVIAYAQSEKSDAQVASALQDLLRSQGMSVFVESRSRHDAKRISESERKLRDADLVVAIVSEVGAASESLLGDLEIARNAEAVTGKPRIVPVLVMGASSATGIVSSMLMGRMGASWGQPSDSESVVEHIVAMLNEPTITPAPSSWLEVPGGALPLNSRFYVERDADLDVDQALVRRDGLILIRGARQIGKTSLLARATTQAKSLGYRVVLSDFQMLNASQTADVQALYKTLAYNFAKALGVEMDLRKAWNDWLAANSSLDEIVEAVLGQVEGPVLWAIDECDRAFGHDYSGDFFGLLRSWYNRRSFDSQGIWDKLSLVLSYATEARLFITDLNQSPFNVGTALQLADFDLDQLQDLNTRYGKPLQSLENVERLADLTGGHPFLSRQAFDWLVMHGGSLDELEEVSQSDAGPFGDHLRRTAYVLNRDPKTASEVRRLLDGKQLEDADAAYRLQAGGVLHPSDSKVLRFRSSLYRDYLSAHLVG